MSQIEKRKATEKRFTDRVRSSESSVYVLSEKLGFYFEVQGLKKLWSYGALSKDIQ